MPFPLARARWEGLGMLLVTNGDSAAERIELAGLADVILPWRDVLHERPVPADLSARELRGVRARFLADRGWASPNESAESFARRDATLANYARHEEVVLFFEHDLYDQLQLLQVLDRFSGRNLGETRLSLAVVDEYLGNLAPERLHALFDGRREVTDKELELAGRPWEAFRSPDPTRISMLLDEDTSALPFLGPALLRHLEQFPSTENGLSRSERQALEAISGGKVVLRETYVASHQEREDLVFLGDTVFASYLEDLSAAEEPLIVFEGGETIRASRVGEDDRWFWERRAALTEKGRKVLRSDADRVELNGIDRWLGGTHLDGQDTWRWDESAGELRRGAA
jgi:hypothetical protein